MSKNKMAIYHNSIVTRNATIEIKGAIENFEDYDPIFKLLPTLEEKDSLIVKLNTPGGCCSVGMELIDAIVAVPCNVHCIVTYPTYSMGALLALCGNQLTIADNSYIMFHDFSSGMRGKGGDMKLYIDNYREVFIKRFNKLCTPFLSKKESADMFNGKDIYIHDTDPSLPDRMKRHFR